MLDNVYTALKEKIKGPVFSIITPFDENENIDYISLGSYINYLFSGGARIFYVMGYNSRYSELSFDEIKELNEFVTKRVKELDSGCIVIVADPLHCSTAVSLEFARHAKDIGADIISLIFREKYYFDDQVYAHYKRVADGCDIGILIHEMPFISGLGGHTIDWPLTLLDRLADIPNVIAIKEDAKNDELSKQVIELLRERVAIVISGGGKRQWLQFAQDGCQAWLNGIGVFEPRLAVEFYKFFLSGNMSAIDRIINEIEVPFFEKAVKPFGWHLAIKSALEAYGVMKRFERMPMIPLDQNSHNEVVKLISSFSIEDILCAKPDAN